MITARFLSELAAEVHRSSDGFPVPLGKKIRLTPWWQCRSLMGNLSPLSASKFAFDICELPTPRICTERRASPGSASPEVFRTTTPALPLNRGLALPRWPCGSQLLRPYHFRLVDYGSLFAYRSSRPNDLPWTEFTALLGLHSQTTRLVDSASWCDRVRAGRASPSPAPRSRGLGPCPSLSDRFSRLQFDTQIRPITTQ
ncbi:hypothetical protein C4D60_Mb00t19040 [Musa balbisiana]|uniref:Uncharacterized protein n=1 Tax=Musa balbisiana TaxID=52838 RepID=A0A4S8I6N6_MUSBA|nr:hypothetical protein C4D60_Mb00t19040 [Musa balbisiana]